MKRPRKPELIPPPLPIPTVVARWRVIRCPACDTRNTSQRRGPDENGMRYHRCLVCGLSFKSFEE